MCPSVIPPPAQCHAEDHPGAGPDGNDHHARGDRCGLGRDEACPCDRLGQDKREDAVLLLSCGCGTGAGNRQRTDHERTVDRADLTAKPPGVPLAQRPLAAERGQ